MSRKSKLTALTIVILVICTFCAWSLKSLYYSGPKQSNLKRSKQNHLESSKLNAQNEEIAEANRQQIPKLFIYTSDAFEEKERKPETTAQLSENEMISRLVAGQEENLRRCYENHLRNNPDSRGEILVDLEVTPYDRAGEVKITKTDFKDPLFLSCVQSVLKQIQYRNKKGESFLISIPLGFN